MKFIGLDAGSVSVKLVVMDERGGRLEGHYKRHKGYPLRVAYDLLKEVVRRHSASGIQHSAIMNDFSLSVTGSAGRIIASALGVGFANELVAQSYATKKMHPHIKTIFELGGEDSKLIILNNRTISDFSMNSVCAAGTGSFLDQQAERLNLTIEDFGELALKSERPSRVAGRCSVFAKSDMIHLQQIATPVEDIVAGLCFAVARNFKGSIVRGRSFDEPVSFHGGVAANKGMVRAFKEVFGFGELFVPEEFAVMGALGAVMQDMDEGITNRFDLGDFKALIESARAAEHGHKPLISEGDNFFRRHGSNAELSAYNYKLPTPDSHPVKAYLGIDIGSISTNLAVIDESGRLIAKRYLMTAGRPIDAVNTGLREIGKEMGNMVEIAGVGTTGSGRYMIADYVGADIVKNEITAQATAAAFIDKNVDTIFEIGGQDSKYISLKDGVIVDFEMNKACAAGTGSFLEEQAEKLNVSVKNDFAEFACSADSPCRLGERCTVFMENSLMSQLQKGADKEDLLAGLAYSIVQNYINKVVAGKTVGDNIFFQGGVAFNKSVVAAFEKYTGKMITVPSHHDVTGAIGMAIIALRHMKKSNESQTAGCNSEDKGSSSGTHNSSLKTAFKGFDLSEKQYKVSSFECRACSNVCEINRVKIEGEDGFLFYGGRCEKYDVKKKKPGEKLPDLFAFREEMLWKRHNKYSAECGMQNSKSKIPIGVPYIFFFHDYLPYWTTLLWELGFETAVSPKTNRDIVSLGTETLLADTCFPVKVAHGHIRYLVEKGINTLFIPSFVNMNSTDQEYKKGCACPLTQTIPYAARVAHPKATVIAPVINLGEGKKALCREITRAFSSFGIREDMVLAAMNSAEYAQEEFFNAIKTRGSEFTQALKERAVVIVGRPYNSFDSGVNLDIPKKLSDIGVPSIPMDFLPAPDILISDKWPNMYWKSGQKILRAARFTKENPGLYAIYIGNFSCGPDSFILKFFNEEMKGKPFLHLEIDEHSADAGAITRCEAFLDSIDQQRMASCQMKNPKSSSQDQRSKIEDSALRSPQPQRVVYIPRMADHAFALAAAFERCGIPAEVLPESDREALDIGRRFASGKECHPCTVTTGDMLKKALSTDFEPDRSAFFMPSGAGPCRFGQYNVFHRMVLDEIGYKEVPIFSPNQDEGFYKELGIVGKDFSAHSWKGIVAYELLSKCLHETRPYEKEKGLADKTYQEYLQKLYFSLRGMDGKPENVLKNARRDFEKIPRNNEQRPLIGVVGEIFVRSNKFSNEDIIKKVEALGGEVWLAPIEEWIYYLNFTSLRNALIKKDRSAIIQILLKELFQKMSGHRLERHFKGFLRTLKEPGTKEVISKASPYLHDSFEGEAILSIGKSIDLIEKGASGIINAMPFGCMPGTVVTTLMRGVSRDYGIPWISIPYDGTESPTMEIQLEAFMNQAKEYLKQKAVSRK